MSKTAVGQMLKEWRESNNLSTLAASFEIGINPTSWNDIERGRCYPSAVNLAKIIRSTTLLGDDLMGAILEGEE